MSVIICNSYNKASLHNFFILLNKEFFLFNNALIKYLYESYFLCKIKIFFLYFSILRKYIDVDNFRYMFILILYFLKCRNKSSLSLFFNLRYCNFFDIIFRSFYNISLTFLISFLLFSYFSYLYVYNVFFFLSYNNNGFGLPRKRHSEVILKSPHGQKKAKEHFIQCLHRRGIRYPSFYVTEKNLLVNQLFNKNKGILVMHKYHITMD